MAKQTLVFTGDKELNRKLHRLKGTEAKKIIRKAARAALRPVLTSAKRNAPHETGALEASLAIRALSRSRRKVGMRVTTREGMFAGDTFYGGFIEWGWKTGKRDSDDRTDVPGQHFMLRAAHDKQRSALAIYKAYIKRGLEGLAKR